MTLSRAAPTGGLNVSLRLGQQGAFAATTLPETRTVTVAAGSTTAAVGVATVDDAASEPDGKIVARVRSANGYAVGAPGSAEVAVRDNDTISATISASISADASPIDEGETASFTLRLTRAAPTGGLNVTVRLSQEGDFATTTLPETRTVTVAAGATTAAAGVATANDALDEPDGRIVARVRTSNGYTAGAPGSAAVVVRDDDNTMVTVSARTSSIPEGGYAGFTVRLSQAAPSGGLAVMVELRQQGDFAAATLPRTRTVRLAGGAMTARLDVATVDDSVDEAHGKIMARAQGSRTYKVGDAGWAEVTVLDNDERERNSAAQIVEQTVPRLGRTIAGLVTRTVDCERHTRFRRDRASIGGVDVRPVLSARAPLARRSGAPSIRGVGKDASAGSGCRRGRCCGPAPSRWEAPPATAAKARRSGAKRR